MFLVKIPVIYENGKPGFAYVNPDHVMCLDEADNLKLSQTQAGARSRVSVISGRFFMSPLTIDQVDGLLDEWSEKNNT